MPPASGSELPNDARRLLEKRDEAVKAIDRRLVEELENLKVTHTKRGDLESANAVVALMKKYETDQDKAAPRPTPPAKAAESGKKTNKVDSHTESVLAAVARAKASPSRQLEIEGMKVVAGKADEKGMLKIDAGPVKMEFPFKNLGPKVVKILEVEPAFTTGVTTAFKDGKMEYAPGESGVLQVTYDPAKETNPWYYKEVRLVCEGDVSQIHPRVHFGIPQ